MNEAKRESRKRYYWAHREEQLAANRKWFAKPESTMMKLKGDFVQQQQEVNEDELHRRY